MIERTGGDLLQWLRGFHNVVLHGNLAKAARQMSLNQSAISHHIKNLENEYKVTLFLREKNKLILTEAGKQLHKRVEELFDLLNATRNELSSDAECLQGKISIATPHSIAQNFLPNLISRFHKQYPDTSFDLRGGSSKQIFEDVKHGVSHFGIISQSRDFEFHNPEMDFFPLFGSRMQIISPIGNPFGLSEECSLRDLCRVPYIGLYPDYAVGLIVEDYAIRNNIQLNIIARAFSFNCLLDMVGSGLGVAIIDTFSAQRTHACENRSIIDELPMRHYIMVTKKKRHLPPQTKAFQQFFLENCPPKNCLSLL